jgi:hypothetical protein
MDKAKWRRWRRVGAGLLGLAGLIAAGCGPTTSTRQGATPTTPGKAPATDGKQKPPQDDRG